MSMVEGPFSKEAAASQCGCDSEDLCPGPLAGIDEAARSTMARWEGPMTPSGTRRWRGRRLRGAGGGPSSPLPRRDPPLGGIVKPPFGGWLWPEPGTRWVLLKADVNKAHRRVKVLRKDWRFQVASGEQGRHIWHG